MLVVELAQKVVMMSRDLEDDDNESSYQCRLFVQENPPRVIVIGRVYPRGSIMHTLPMQDDFSRVVVEKVRDASDVVLVPTTKVNTVGEVLEKFIACLHIRVRQFQKTIRHISLRAINVI